MKEGLEGSEEEGGGGGDTTTFECGCGMGFAGVSRSESKIITYHNR